MSFNFGFEVEGFYTVDNTVQLPPKDYPHDDFPGLVEARTEGGKDLKTQLYLLQAEKDSLVNVDWTKTEHIFTPQQKVVIRRRHYEKGGVSINNIYGKSPKELGARTLASFQINLSLNSGHVYDKREVRHHLTGLFDIVEIIRNFDEEFKVEIAFSKRQPGFYSIKDDKRLEYRSLPNFVSEIPLVDLIKRIKKCV
jgi:hypothetical protein